MNSCKVRGNTHIGLADAGAIILVCGLIGFLCTRGDEASPFVHKKAALHRTGAMRTSENASSTHSGE